MSEPDSPTAIAETGSWFEELFGFAESAEEVRRQLCVEETARGNVLCYRDSRANGVRFGIGTLETPSLGELRERAPRAAAGSIRVRNFVGEVGELHHNADNGDFFQVASQFNLLEMVAPTVTPESGVTNYVHDSTQGPACALSAAAATVYRNYFVPVAGGIGQSEDRQIDFLHDLHQLLAKGRPNNGIRLWTMQNGYALLPPSTRDDFNSRFGALDEPGRDKLRAALRIGVQRNVQVTRAQSPSHVTQCFCSALPLTASPTSSKEWRAFARLILEASYEATLLAAAENLQQTGNPVVYLTMVGGGAFGNDDRWIQGAMERAFAKLAHMPLDVRIVHYNRIRDRYLSLARDG